VSQGYNICDALGKPAKTNPLLVERDLDTTYGIDGGSGLDATIAPIQNVQSASTLINSLPPLIVP
jgi:hypothetical protein